MTVCTRPGAAGWTCAPAPVAPTAFHRALPGYRPTALTEVPELARELGVGRLFVKDESARLGLPAFKALGASWAIHETVRARAGAPSPPDLDRLRALAATVPGLRLVAATDGNHGRAVARFAHLLGLPADIYVPHVVDPRSVEAIRGEHARVVVVEDGYDATVATAARAAAADPATALIQDTAWPGYTAVPATIVDGYATLFREIDRQLAEAGVHRADAVAVPVGVGSLAQAAVTHYRGGEAPRGTAVVSVEPESAACVLRSLQADRPVTVTTGRTSMDGLNCGTPSMLAWPYLRHGLDAAVTVTDVHAADAIRDLRAHGIATGPCGGAGLAGVRALVHHRSPAVGPRSVTVLLCTEGPR
jgi:diaminopropionate ammonia-lyase